MKNQAGVYKLVEKTVVRGLDLMRASQHEQGGFGPQEWCVPSAGGSIQIEMLAARQLGIVRPEYEAAAEKAMEDLLRLQKGDPDRPADGAFFGMTEAMSLRMFEPPAMPSWDCYGISAQPTGSIFLRSQLVEQKLGELF